MFNGMPYRLMKPINFDPDMSRIYVLGHSMGGMGTYLFIRSDPSKTRDIPVWALSDVASIKDIPIWAFHGDQEPVFLKWLFKQKLPH
jgi:predicted peptidase